MGKNKKMALVFAGLHYFENYKIQKPQKKEYCLIDYRTYTRNINEKIIEYFKGKNYDVDIYICTNNSIYKEDFIRHYKPVRYVIENSNTRIKKIKTALGLINPNKYDMIFITRPDIYIVDDFNKINYDKFNIVSKLEKHDTVDDNIHIFPSKYFKIFINELSKLNENDIFIMHSLDLSRIFGKNNINYLKNEHDFVKNLSFFGIRFFYDDKPFAMSRYLFSENCSYFYKNAEMVIVSDTIVIKSTPDYSGASLTYKLGEQGKYLLSFSIISNIDIPTNYALIRLFKQDVKFNLINIHSGEKTKISVVIDVENKEEELIFDFSSFSTTEKEINVSLSNIVLGLNVKCSRAECKYIVNTNIGYRNIYATSCCLACKNSIEGHGKRCEKIEFTDNLPVLVANSNRVEMVGVTINK